MRVMHRQLVFVALFGCSGDAPLSADAPLVPDSGACVGVSATCEGDVFTTCVAAGETPVQETCGWGCETAGCKRVTPTGGAAVRADLFPLSLGAFAELSLSGTLDGSTGRINGVDASAMNVDYKLVDGIAVFRFKLLAIGGLKLQGAAPIQLLSDGPITVDGTLDATGSCGIGSPELAGAGGGNGGLTSGSTGALIGGGIGGPGGGGGGGWGGVGGATGAGALGGISTDDPTVITLRGGAGGGAGVGSTTFQGGGGGGAIQLISNTSITIATAGNINAGGCGGRKGTAADDEGGGGGAGGTIVLEAPVVTARVGPRDRGQRWWVVPSGRAGAVGGNAGTNGGTGGVGGSTIIDGGAGGAGTLAGGGGGAVGRIRINTRSGTAVIEVMSPAFDDPTTTATQGIAALPSPDLLLAEPSRAAAIREARRYVLRMTLRAFAARHRPCGSSRCVSALRRATRYASDIAGTLRGGGSGASSSTASSGNAGSNTKATGAAEVARRNETG